jgi:hypothetical protein
VNELLLKPFRTYAVFSVLFLLYLATLIFTGFLLHINVNRFTLITAYSTYVAITACYLLIRHSSKAKLKLFLLGTVLTPLVFWGLTTAFGHTYDTSYDGQDYQLSAVIELANGWNPIYQQSLPIQLTNGTDGPVVHGYAKIVWSVEASIYKLTNNIDSVSVVNPILALLAFVFCITTLIDFGIDVRLSAVVSLLTIVNTIVIEQIFTAREDAIGYEFLIIAACSLISLIKTKNNYSSYLCLLTALIFLAGIKYNELFVLLPLALLTIYIVFRKKLYKTRPFKIALYAGIVIGVLTLFNPYITNVTRYNSIDYPYNLKSFSSLVSSSNVPTSLRGKDRLELFYYGIFSEAQTGVGHAHLKLPFSLTPLEMRIEAMPSAKLVGGYGVLFSGILIVSIGTYAYMGIRRKSKAERVIFSWLSVALGLIIVSCLLSPTPNYSRFNGQLELFPIVIIIALLCWSVNKELKVEKAVALILIFLVSFNIYIDAVVATSVNETEFASINTQLISLKKSDGSYLVYSDFYSNYVRLEKHGIKIAIMKSPVKCNNTIILVDSYDSTELCKS